MKQCPVIEYIQLWVSYLILLSATICIINNRITSWRKRVVGWHGVSGWWTVDNISLDVIVSEANQRHNHPQLLYSQVGHHRLHRWTDVGWKAPLKDTRTTEISKYLTTKITLAHAYTGIYDTHPPRWKYVTVNMPWQFVFCLHSLYLT